MLENLRIQNYALIDDVEIELGPGFNVLTGETGAGKSIVVGALNLVLGARASSDVVRDGADRARIDSVFRVDKPSKRLMTLLREFEIDMEDGQLLLSRTVGADGRSRAYAGGNAVSVAVLAEIGDELIDMHGQHEHQSLLKLDRQLDLLDGFAGVEEQAARVARQVGEVRELDRAIAELENEDRERERRIEFMRFEVKEIRSAGLRVGEEEGLRQRRNLLANAEKIFELSSNAYRTLYESEQEAVIDALDGALRDVEELARIDARFKPMADALGGARATVDDLASELREFSGELDFDAEELDALNARLALIGDLKRKYGESVEAIIEYEARCAAEIECFEQRDERLGTLRDKRKRLLAEVERAAEELSTKRKAAARKLDKKISAALGELGMTGGQFETGFERTDIGHSGLDRVEFLLAANPGEKLKPLRLVASGGEISRVMLALKSVFADADKIPTLIFDEIDAGVGGAVATKVAGKLRELAASHQTICISHLPQIAAAAASHYHVSKASSDKRTTTTVARLDEDARVSELARMLDGSVSDVSLQHAKALLKKGG